MFHVGDKVFYPMHGAGTIKAIEKREIQGETKEYYVVNIPTSQMDVMIPKEKVGGTTLRLVADKSTLKEILSDFHKGDLINCPLPWSKRNTTNMEKIKSGDIHDAAEVVRELTYRNIDKPLNASERHTLNEARKLFISELTIIKGITENQAAKLLAIPG